MADNSFPFVIYTHAVPLLPMRTYPHAILDEQKDLFLSVKRYVPIEAPRHPEPITLIATTGLGFHKELYEPLFAALYQHLSHQGVSIRAIWIADMFNSGYSSILNEENLGVDPSWTDHARDLLTFIQHFRKDMIRPIYGLGHSMGCAQLVYLSHWLPRLFEGMVCIEPGLDAEYGRGIIFNWVQGVLRQKDKFGTQEDAEKAVMKGYSAKEWDPSVHERLRAHGIHQQDGQWKTTMKKEQVAGLVVRFNPGKVARPDEMTEEEREQAPDLDPEAWNPDQCYRQELKGAWDLLPQVRPKVLYINGAKSPFFGRTKVRDERMHITGNGVGGNGGMKVGAVEQVNIKKGEHTMVFDSHLNEVADHAAKWLGKEVRRWQSGPEKRRKEWEAKSKQKRQSLPEGFRKAVDEQAAEERRPKLQKRDSKL